MEDYYKILGVSKSASKDEIKKAYRKLAHKHHPDKGGDEKTFKKISEAYQVLSNESKREQYDRFGKSGPSMGGGGANSGFGGFGNAAGMDFDFGDIFEQVFGFKRGGYGRQSTRGEDIKIRITTDLTNIVKDDKRTINLTRMVFCDKCNGTGDAPGAKKTTCSTCHGQGKVKTAIGPFAQITTCPHCMGSGKVSDKKCSSCRGEGRVGKKEEIKFTIPAGIDSGQMLRIEGKGNIGKNGSPAGDLLVDITVRNNSKFERRGADLYYTAQPNYTQLALGDKINVTLITGKNILVKIPPGTSPDTVFRISGKGLPVLSGSSMGNLYVKMKIGVPKKITKKQKEILEELKKEGL